MATLGKAFVDALKEGVQKSGEKDAKAFAKGLDSLQRNVSGVANLFRGSELVSSLVVRDQLSSTVFSSSTGWQVKGDGTATFRNVTVSGGSLLITNTTDRIHLQSDGDAFFGSDISAAATTSFSIFSNAQTYNSESMGAGDILFGDNSANKANLLWDASAGKILLRGGTTIEGYYDTTGRAVFGGGNLYLHNDGMSFIAGSGTANSIVWHAAVGDVGTGTYLSGIYADKGGTTPNFEGQLIISSVGVAGSTATGKIELCTNGKAYPFADVYLASTDTIASLTLAATYSAALSCQLRLDLTQITANYLEQDINFQVKGDTATNLLVCDAGLDAVQIGTTVAGAIADFRSTGAVFNEVGADADTRFEGDADANLLTLDAGLDTIGIGGVGISGQKLSVYGDMQASGYTGWNFANETWTRTAATTFTVPTDLTLKYQKGTKIKLTDTTTKYFYVTASSYSNPNTTVTVTGGSDYSLVGAISNPFYSYIENPRGFPDWFNYAPTITGYSANPASPVYQFRISGTTAFLSLREGTPGTSNATTLTYTLPVIARVVTGQYWSVTSGQGADNSASIAGLYGIIGSGATIITCYKTELGLPFTASGTKSFSTYGVIVLYQI